MIKSRRMRLVGHASRMEMKINVCRLLVGMSERKRPLGRPRCRWVDDTKIYLVEMGWGGDWIGLAQDRDNWRALVNAVTNLRVPYSAGKLSGYPTGRL
jgi:hypothetical protein